ncbi:MAG: hypothetical protein ACK5Q5_14240 [Planctomycetaceae bacterium]
MKRSLPNLVCCFATSVTLVEDQPRYKSYSPFTPGVQNQSQPSGGTYQPNDKWGPYNPGVQNNSRWNNGSNWNNGNTWSNPNNSGWNQGGWNQSTTTYPSWSQPQPQTIYRPPESRSAAPSPPAVSYSGQPITILMPDNQSGLCNYSLASGSNQWNYSIGPGLGTQSYRLESGLYRFRRTSSGWGLFRTTDAAPPATSAAPPPPM